jgi:hypothetical protein
LSDKEFWDYDNTLAIGPPSLGTIWDARRNILPQIVFTDNIENFLHAELERAISIKETLLGMSANILHSPVFRWQRAEAITALAEIAALHGPESEFLLSGRPARLLDSLTRFSLNYFGTSEYLQGGILLRPHGFKSAGWKANVIRYFALKDPEHTMSLIDNDLVATVAIGESLLQAGITNARLFIRTGIEMNPAVMKFARVGALPENVIPFGSFAQLPGLLRGASVN